MNLDRCHLEEQLRTARLESMELRRKLHELKSEFVQLRQAFDVNLRMQKHREIRLGLLTHENQEIRGFAEECLRNIAKLQRTLKRAENERYFWQGKTMRGLKEAEQRRNEIEILEKSVRKNHEDVSISARNAWNDDMETRLTELTKLYDEAEEKVRRLEEETLEATRQKEFFESRTRELSNLLTTLEHFDLDAKTVCRLTATAVENLPEAGLSFAETVKKLRQFTWEVDNRKSATEVDTLRSQNLILREIVKSLKRKVQCRPENQSSKVDEEKQEKRIEESNESCDTKNDINGVPEPNVTTPFTQREASLPEKSDLVGNGASSGDQTNINAVTEFSEPLPMEHNCENKDIVSNANGKVPCIESHTNEFFFEEYVIQFSNSRQMKIKHSPEASAKAAHLKLEFLDSEDKYRSSSPDEVVILLKNLCASIKIGHANINCATQTKPSKKCKKNTLIPTANMHDFPRLNVGYTMLNSEKRAIERNLSKLERTVTNLKSTTLHHARSIVGKKSKYLGNDQFFECIERLAGN